MLRQTFYQRIIYPFTVAAMAATVVLFLYGAKNLVGESHLPGPRGVDGGKGPVIKLIKPVEKKVELEGDIHLDSGKNPFTADHKDWVVVFRSEEGKGGEAEGLHLQVRGIVTINSTAKAMVVDIDEKNGKSFWLTVGDIYKGYRVAYISQHNIIFIGEGKNIRFALKRGQGKLYAGNGEIFVAPDIDLYLDRLREEEGTEGVTAEHEGEIDGEDVASSAARAGPVITGQGDELSENPGGTGTTSTDAAGTAGSLGQQGISLGTSKADEIAFIKELLEILRKQGGE